MQPVCNTHQIVERHSVAVNFLHIVPHGVTLDQVLSRFYWDNAWKRLEGKERSTIDFIAEDGSWEAHARITKVAAGSVQFRILREWHDAPATSDVPDGYLIQFIAENGWRAQDPNGALIIDKQPQRGIALDAALDHATTTQPKKKKVA